MSSHQQKRLAQTALNAALRLRQSRDIGISEAISVFDFAENMNIEVRFVDIPSLEGMYLNKPRHEILISSHRPPGRQAYTCAHEIGHHLFNHGSRIDEVVEKVGSKKEYDPDEFLVNIFAGFLLMPKTTVNHAFFRRGWQSGSCTPHQVFTVACWLGVGYSALITQMTQNLRILSYPHAEQLLKVTPKKIRHDLLGEDINTNLYVVDHHWTGRPIDIQIDDLILLPPYTKYDSGNIKLINTDNKVSIFSGFKAGLDRLYNDKIGWSSFVRVSRKGYAGRSIYRHLEEPEDD